jgi:hypothetical protein
LSVTGVIVLLVKLKIREEFQMEKTYHGSCHCGAVQYEADLDLEAGTGRCNCTFCSKNRTWGITIKPEKFRLLEGKEALSGYQFNTKAGTHRFCSKCGVRVFGDADVPELGGKVVSISIATLDEIEPETLASLPVNYSDGLHDNWWNAPKVTSYL